MSNPSVTIITPSYNQADFIEDTIKSVLNQTYENITHIIIDGDSKDGTLDILESYDDEIKWISESDNGQAHAVNKGIKLASGDIIGWINSDDMLAFRNSVEEVVNEFDQSCADIVFGHALTVGPKNELLRVQYVPSFNETKLKRHCYLIQPSVFFHREVFSNNNLNEERRYSMDYELWLDLCEQNYDWTRLNRILSADRNHPNRKIIASSKESRKDTLSLRNEKEIDQSNFRWIHRIYDIINVRFRRIRGLLLLFEVMKKPAEQFAFDIIRPPPIHLLKSQLLFRRRSL